MIEILGRLFGQLSLMMKYSIKAFFIAENWLESEQGKILLISMSKVHTFFFLNF